MDEHVLRSRITINPHNIQQIDEHIEFATHLW